MYACPSVNSPAFGARAIATVDAPTLVTDRYWKLDSLVVVCYFLGSPAKRSACQSLKFVYCLKRGLRHTAVRYDPSVGLARSCHWRLVQKAAQATLLFAWRVL